MLTTVLYDGSLAGLLTVVFSCFADKLQVERLVREHRFAPGFFEQSIQVATNEPHAQRVWRGVRKLDGFDEELVLRCWLFDTEQSDTDVVHLLRRLFADGAWAAEDYRDEAVHRCQQVHRRMFREIHRMHAFVRFREDERGAFVSEVEPDFDVLPLAVSHFEERYQDQEWLIYDRRRGYGFWKPLDDGTAPRRPDGIGRAIRVSPQTMQAAHAPTEADALDAHRPAIAQAAVEDGFQDLWRAYFSSVNIAERNNTKLHHAHLPPRYWKYLSEKQPVSKPPP